jgi:hypothetical protein
MKHFNFVAAQKQDYAEIEKMAQAKCIKMPVAHRFFIAEEPIALITQTGHQYADRGDYVIIGKDHAWPVSKEYFEEHYHEIPE